ncbi:MAG: hypothetical protein MUC55_09160 [Burkholderiales bacterium]|nr:hypothetical protein [Burkholderiales bacterium]
MRTDHFSPKRRNVLRRSAAAGVLIAAAGLGAVAHAEPGTEPSARPSPDLATLERAFWMCDHAATTRGVDGDTAQLCVVVTDEFKQARFGGDFERLLEWWRQHKPAEHARLDRDAGSLASR